MKALKIIFLALFLVGLFPFSLIIVPILIIISFKSYDKINIEDVVNGGLNNRGSQISYDKIDNEASAEEFFKQTRIFKRDYLAKQQGNCKTRIWDDQAESYLNCINRYGRVTFKNLILNSYSGNTPHAEIDEVILTPFGIYCVEYKSHCGIIFGSKNQKKWTQCKYNRKVSWNNPIHQNYKHVRALEDLLGNDVKEKIHSYVVYPNAKDVHVDSRDVFSSVNAMEYEISKHTKQVYSLKECRQILKILAFASSRGRDLKEIHISEVQTYLATLKA